MGRLYVIPARESDTAVILRRGPSMWYHVMLWDTRRDRIVNGAWLKGRIFEEKCDLSPDGNLFIYFVRKDRVKDSAFTHAYTAVSRPPWLTALIVWPEGTTYGGGAEFTAPRTVWGVSMRGTHPEFPLKGLELAESPLAPRPKPDSIAGADWTGYDHGGNVIYSRGDSLYRRKKNKSVLVADFSQLRPDPQPAPEWASRPLRCAPGSSK